MLKENNVHKELLEKDIRFLKGVGPQKVQFLNKLGIKKIEDIITYFPREYEDRSKVKKINELQDGEEALISVRALTNIVEINAKRLKLYKLIACDDTAKVQIIWYNQQYLKSVIKRGNNYKFYGKVSIKNGEIQMASPVFDANGISNNTGKIVPIYSLTYGITQFTLRKIIESALNEVDKNNAIVENLPDYILKKYNLYDRKTAIKEIHFPRDFDTFKRAKTRLAFEELLLMQIKLLSLKNQYKLNKGIEFNKNVNLEEVIDKLPFKLTNAQLRVINEIEDDMESSKNMNRLVQGDVGSGKTVVAMLAAYKAVKSGYQVAMMAPTAILASQHEINFKTILEQYGIRCELLISGITAKNKRETLKRLENGEIDIIIGTHAVLEENVVFKNLGLVITDEQHRFGVKQRAVLTEKGKSVDTLVMTATPIPRTLALILFGDLDISIIDELPPNRKKIDTFAVTKALEERVNKFIEKQIKEGKQVYIVCPLVEENEEIDAKSVLETVEKYKNEILKDYKVEYLHGKMKSKEKEEIMQNFKSGKIDVLISTTVIEVGVDVPNATVMVIENAERFGLAQLHQLRGRVGRGQDKSYCILKFKGNSEIIRKRMQIMVETNDGFKIAEKDLELRGTGEFFGTKQHGIPDFKIANLFEDMKILVEVQKIALEIIKEDPKFELEKNILLKEAVNEKIVI